MGTQNYNNRNQTNGYNRKQNGYSNQQQPPKKMIQLTDTNYVNEADQIMKQFMDRRDGGKLTTSKIRNILSMVSDLYNQVIHISDQELTEEIQGGIQYLKMRIAYESGRDSIVKEFEKETHLLKQIDTIGTNKQKMIRFCRYMEALVAYHKFHGGKD